MGWFEIYGVMLSACVTTFLGQLPYIMIDKERLKSLQERRKELHMLAKKTNSDSPIWEKAVKDEIATSVLINKTVLLPMILQFAIIGYSLSYLRRLNIMPYWFLLYLPLAILFGMMWRKIL